MRSWILPLVIRDTSSKSSISGREMSHVAADDVDAPIDLFASRIGDVQEHDGVINRCQGVSQFVCEHRQKLVLAAIVRSKFLVKLGRADRGRGQV